MNDLSAFFNNRNSYENYQFACEIVNTINRLVDMEYVLIDVETPNHYEIIQGKFITINSQGEPTISIDDEYCITNYCCSTKDDNGLIVMDESINENIKGIIDMFKHIKAIDQTKFLTITDRYC